MSGPKAPRSRLRRALTLGGVAAVAVGAVNAPALIGRLFPPEIAFQPIADPPGFRRMAAGDMSGGFDPFVGLGDGAATRASIDPAILRADLCGALFGGPPPPGVVPVASFSDYYCPFCRVLTRRLAALEEAGGVRVAWHEWPLLGDASEVAARAALSAGRQGAYVAFHEALMRGGFLPTSAFLADLAGRIGVDPARMLADMDSPEVARRIAEARGLAALFGFIGTPALVVGRTVVMGEISDNALRALIDRERADGPPPVCAA